MFPRPAQGDTDAWNEYSERLRARALRIVQVTTGE
jgi:hypothetical protein